MEEKKSQGQGQNQNQGQGDKKKNNYRRSKNYRYNSNRRRSNNDRRRSNNRGEKRYNYRRERKILGKCLLCGSNVSDEIYGIKIDENYVHFECAVKRIRQQMKDESSKQRNYKVYYTGSGNFSAVHEKNIKGNIKWQILLQVNIKDFPEVQLAKEQEESEDTTS